MYPPIHPQTAPFIAPSMVNGIKSRNEPVIKYPKKYEIAPVTSAFFVPIIISSKR